MNQIINNVALLVLAIMFLIVIPLATVSMISKFARISFKDAAELGLSYTVLSSLYGDAKIEHSVRFEELKMSMDQNMIFAGICERESFLRSVWDSTTICFLALIIPSALIGGIKGILIAGVFCARIAILSTMLDRLFTPEFFLCRGGRQFDKIRFVPAFSLPFIPNYMNEYFLKYDEESMYIAGGYPSITSDGWMRLNDMKGMIAIRLKEFEGREYGSLVYKFKISKDKNIIRTEVESWK